MGANGFSIREYTNKMRSVDVFKCWPFSTSPSVTRQDLQSWLPPMSSASSLSNNQLQSLRSNLPQPSRSFEDEHHTQSDKSDDNSAPPPSPNLPEPCAPLPPSSACDDEKFEMVCPVCREFNAATLTAVNAHIDGCLAQTVREDRRNHVRMVASTSTTGMTTTTTTTFKSSKSKVPKKRSIAEIFKVQQEEEKDKEKEKEDEKKEEAERIESVLNLWKKDSGIVDESVVDEVSITVTKFRWLSRRLEALRSGRRGVQSAKSDGGAGVSAVAAAAEEEDEEKSEMVCPVCRDFNAATVTAVNAHIDNCLAQAVRDERRHMRRKAALVVGGNCSKQKPKALKKRSIAEILTVAPPIGATKTRAIEVAKDDGEEAEEYNEDEDKSNYIALASAEAVNSDADVVSIMKSKKGTAMNKSKKMVKRTKKAKKKSKVEKHGDGLVSMNSEKKTIVSKSKKKKEKKKSFFSNEMTAKKEDACKRKVQTSVHGSRKMKGTIGNKMVVLHGSDPSTHEKKLGSKILSVEKKQKFKNFDPTGKQQKAVSPVRGIYKNHFKHVSRKISSGSNTQDGTDEYHCDDEMFTCKDDVLGPKKRNSFDETMLNKSSGVLATSLLVKEQSSESDEASASLQTNRNYDYKAFNIGKRKEICSIVESKEFSTTLEQASAVPNFLKPCTSEDKSMVLEENSESLTKVAFCDNSNLHAFDGGDATTSHCSPYDDISMPLSTVDEVKMPGLNVQVCESGSLSSIRKFIDHLEDPTFQAAREDSYANTRTFLEPPSSYFASYDKGNEREQLPLQTYGDNDSSGQVLSDRQLSHMFGMDMINYSFPYTGWGKGSVRSNCQNPNLLDLPFNTHGELINFSSSGKLGTNQLETSSALQGSVSGLPVNNIFHQRSQENLSISERHAVQTTSPKDGLNPYSHYPARLAVSELPCSEREDIHRPNSVMCSSSYVQPLNSEMDIMRSSSVGQDQHDRVLNLKGIGMVSVKESSDHVTLSSSQPTMRLMGKDVPIGRSSKVVQQLTGDNWADEENRRQHFSEYAALENSFPERCSKQDCVSGSSLQMSTYNVVQSVKTRSNKSFPDTVLMNGPDAEFPRQFTDLQSNHVQNGVSVSRNASSYFHPTAQEHASCAVFKGAPDEFPEQFVPGAKPLGRNSQSQVQATPRNFSQPACFSNGELNDRDKIPHVSKLAFEFPFLQTAIDEQANTSWFQKHYRSLPSWLSNSTDERLPVTFSQNFSGLNSQTFPQNSWTNKFTPPSANHSAEVLYPSIRLNSLGSMKTTPLCSSPVQPLQAPVTSSYANNDCRNLNNVTDRVKLDYMISKDHHQHPCADTRKRPASALDDCRKPIKLPNIGVQENMSGMTSRLTGENSSSEMQRNTRIVKLDPHVDGARSRRCQNEAQKLNPTSYPAVDSFKLDGSVTSGPVRLGPRAKHILRSS